MNATFVACLAPLHQKPFPMRKMASLALALALLGTLAGCGKSSKATAPVTSSSSGPKTESEAKQVAQQSAAMGNTCLEQAKSLPHRGNRPRRPAGKRAPVQGPGYRRRQHELYVCAPGYDISGDPIDWAMQSDQLAPA